MAPLVDVVGARYEGRVRLRRLNVDESRAEARELGVRAVPMLLASHDGREVARVLGRQPRARLIRIFERALRGARARPLGPTPLDRVLRTAAAVVIAFLSLHAESPVLVGAAVAVLGAAYWDLFLTRTAPDK